jgi:hypothetical protein
MEVPTRSRRRHDRWRMRQRMLQYWALMSLRSSTEPLSPPTDEWLGNMVSTHGKPCSCIRGCGNRRRTEGASIAERRRSFEW